MREKSEAIDPRLPIGTNYCKCSVCGLVFGGAGGFDYHRRESRCLSVEALRRAGYSQDELERWRRAAPTRTAPKARRQTRLKRPARKV